MKQYLNILYIIYYEYKQFIIALLILACNHLNELYVNNVGRNVCLKCQSISTVSSWN